MSGHNFWLSEAQFARLQSLPPDKVNGVHQVDDRRVISGIIHVIRNVLGQRYAPSSHGPRKTHRSRFVRWCGAEVCSRIFEVLAAVSGATGTVITGAASLLKRGSSARRRTHKRRAQLEAPHRLRR